MSAAEQNLNARKTEKASYCQQCGCCPTGQKDKDENCSSNPVETDLDTLIRRVTEEVIRELKRG